VQAKKVDDLCEIIFEAYKGVIATGLYRLSTGGVVRHRLAVIKHFVTRLL
jgi:hypothetical protein